MKKIEDNNTLVFIVDLRVDKKKIKGLTMMSLTFQIRLVSSKGNDNGKPLDHSKFISCWRLAHYGSGIACSDTIITEEEDRSLGNFLNPELQFATVEARNPRRNLSGRNLLNEGNLPRTVNPTLPSSPCPADSSCVVPELGRSPAGNSPAKGKWRCWNLSSCLLHRFQQRNSGFRC
ncbi:hypothetical protein ZIOFF_042562 [Zingiber officinale]|uniref:Uncharacterized protein n=1 Tax=Zingiber officinale TaxID=94328 RepID=A0A8J5KYW6_ZINOF|nr:hypothetical protein ZIOFF_042562 [Zingiber officinale]